MIGAVVAWLCTTDEADAFNGQNIEAQYFCHERGLLPAWPGPRAHENNIRYDRSGRSSKSSRPSSLVGADACRSA